MAEHAKPQCPKCWSDHFVVECHLHRKVFWWYCTECGWEADRRDAPASPGLIRASAFWPEQHPQHHTQTQD